MQRLLENKVAVVTGSSQGLGLAIAAALGVDGAMVLVVSRAKEKAERAVAMVEGSGGVASAWVGDVRDEEAAERVVEAAVKSFGGIHILVNSAGLFLWKPFMEVTRREWCEVLETNLTSAFCLSQSVARAMIDQGRGGAIINIGSIHGSVPDPHVVPQCASKFGLVGLTKATAAALRDFDIRVNLVAPGSIEPDSAGRRGGSPRERVTQADIASLVVYLASDLAKTVTGSVIDAFGATRPIIKA